MAPRSVEWPAVMATVAESVCDRISPCAPSAAIETVWLPGASAGDVAAPAEHGQSTFVPSTVSSSVDTAACAHDRGAWVASLSRVQEKVIDWLTCIGTAPRSVKQPCLML